MVQSILSKNICEGIENFVGWNSILHPRFMQTAASTGRYQAETLTFKINHVLKLFQLEKLLVDLKMVKLWK